MRDTIEFRLEGLRLEGLPAPETHTYSTYVEVPA
jgi:endonuclease YncB( thermonuclease family)